MNLIGTMTHNKSINEKLLDQPEWAIHVEQEGKLVAKWMNYWINVAKKKETPVYFIRFEDLTSNPKETLSDVFSYFLDVESIEGTIIEKRIEEIISPGQTNSLIYKPRIGGGGTNSQMNNYTPEMVEYLKDSLSEMVHFFGYAK